MMLWQCCTQYTSKFEKLICGYRTRKYQFSFQSQRKSRPKNVKTTIQLCSFHVSKVMLKIHHVRLQQYVNQELLVVQGGFRKGRGTTDQIANISWITDRAREFQKKTSTFVSLITLKPLPVWMTTKCGKFFKRWNYQTTLPVSWEACRQVKRQ